MRSSQYAGRHVLELVPIVVRRVVHQHRDRAGLRLDARRAPRCSAVDVREVALDELRARRRGASTSALRFGFGDVEEEHARLLRARSPRRSSAPMPEPPPVTTTVLPAREG